MSGKELEKLLTKYFTSHSARRINYLHWNSLGVNTLNFVNLSGADLTRLNNAELIFRSIRVKDTADWEALSNFINTFIVAQPKVTYIIRVDYLVSYLKKLKFDTSVLSFSRNSFGTVMSTPVGDNVSVKPIAIIDDDIQSMVLLDRLYNKYRKMMFSDDPSWDISDILEEYLTSDTFKFKLDELSMQVVASLDIVDKKFVQQSKNVCPKTKLEQIFVKNGITTVVSRFTGDNMCIITARVHLQYFLNKYAGAKS